MKQSDPKKLLAKHKQLTQSDSMKVISHTQRKATEKECDGSMADWITHSLMLDGCQVPFKFKRQGKYQTLKGAQVNLTYYPDTESVAGLEFEVMRVVRIKRS